jgi:hypothetical protein
MPKWVRLGSVERFAGNVAIRPLIRFRVEIAQPHVDPKGRQAAAERAVTAIRIERNFRQI